MNFFILLDPKNFNLKWGAGIVAVVTVIMLLAVWGGMGEDEEFLEQQPKMALTTHPERKLPIVDLDSNGPLGKKEFHTAVLGKQFLVKGVELTLVKGEENKRRMSYDPQAYKYNFYSAVVSSDCVGKIQAMLGQDSGGQNSLSEIVRMECPGSQGKFAASYGSDDPLTEDSLKKVCAEGSRCAPCIIIANTTTRLGECTAREITFIDESNVITTQGQKSINVQYRLSDKLSYKD